MNSKKFINVMVTGYEFSGKSTLISIFRSGTYLEMYTPGALDVGSRTTENYSKLLNLRIWDTSRGTIEYNLINLIYPGADVILVCFSIGSCTSMLNVLSKWIPEARKHSPNTPIIVVGCKQDLCIHPKCKSQEKKMFLEDTFGYLECSSKLNEGVKEVFDFAAKAAFPKVKAF